MPNGRVMRIDEERQCAYVVRGGRSYEAPLSEVESAARVPGARVRYRLRRSGGVERAEQVKLRSGTRTNKSQRRFGDLTGARQPGTNVQTSGQKAYGIDVATQPFRVAEAWVSAMGDLDFDAATSLYLPGAVVHSAASSVAGRSRIRADLEASSWAGISPAVVELQGLDQYVRAERSDGDAPTAAYFFIDHGQIVEHWIDTEPDSDGSAPAGTEVQILTKGKVGQRDRAYAEKRLAHLIDVVGPSIVFARMKLSHGPSRTEDTPARAEVTVDVDGPLVRAHAASPTMTEAIDLAVTRLRANLDRRHDRERHWATPLDARTGDWRPGFLPPVRAPYYEREPEEREIVRHKSFAPDEMTVDEAVWDMSLLDYDFFLFVELSTGQDCLLERRDDEDPRLHLLDPDSSLPPSSQGDVPISQEIAPTLRTSEAIALLDEAGRAFLFFRNRTTDRGNVIYRRYDGHYGLITPPDPAEDSEESS